MPPGNMKNRRPDLEAFDVNPNFPYLAERIFPVWDTMKKEGKLYYQDLTSDVAAQTGRTPGDAPTITLESSSNVDYSTAERIGRRGTPDDEDQLMGGVEAAYRRMTTGSKRSIQRANEDLVIAAIFGTVQQRDILDSLAQALDVVVDALKRYTGKLVFACGWSTFRRITRFTEVTNTLLRTGVVRTSAEAIRYVTAITLADILGVDEVIVGDDDHWGTTSVSSTLGKALVYKEVPGADGNGTVMDPREEVQFGRLAQYLPGGEGQPSYTVEAYYDDNTLTYRVTSRVWNVAKLLNGGAGYVLAGIDEGNATTTTTTTTTAA